MSDIEAAGGATVRGADGVSGVAQVRERLVAAGAPGLLVAKDPTLWGAAAEPEARIRLGWLDTFRQSRQLLPTLAELRAKVADLDHVVLAGMGGSSLAAEVITATLGVPLTVLDTTDAHQVRAALADRLARTVVVVSSKSGSTVEIDSHRRIYQQAFADAGIGDVARHFVFVTDPGSALEAMAAEMGAHLVLADPEVGGRYSALTAFGLVPAALAGVDVAQLLDQAEQLHASLAGPDDNPTLALASALAAAVATGRDKLTLIDDGTGITGLGDWAEQLIAESTGKEGTGILPVVLGAPSEPGAFGDDVLTVTIGGALNAGDVPGVGILPDLSVNGPLGAQFLLWEAAVALAGRELGINPFDQPNVAESKANTNAILTGGAPVEAPRFVAGAIEVRAANIGDVASLGDPAAALAEVLQSFLGGVSPEGYVAVMAYLDRLGDARAALTRHLLAARTHRPVTFGWGPRFLHSTGQYHKGGPAVGSFLQITGATTADLAVPGQPYSLAVLQAAQAAGDRQALAGRGRPLLWLHLTDRAGGIAQLLDIIRSMPSPSAITR